MYLSLHGDRLKVIHCRNELITLAQPVVPPAKGYPTARHIFYDVVRGIAPGPHLGLYALQYLIISSEQAAVQGEMEVETLKKFIAFSRAKCGPRLSEETASKLGHK